MFPANLFLVHYFFLVANRGFGPRFSVKSQAVSDDMRQATKNPFCGPYTISARLEHKMLQRLTIADVVRLLMAGLALALAFCANAIVNGL